MKDWIPRTVSEINDLANKIQEDREQRSYKEELMPFMDPQSLHRPRHERRRPTENETNVYLDDRERAKDMQSQANSPTIYGDLV